MDVDKALGILTEHHGVGKWGLLSKFLFQNIDKDWLVGGKLKGGYGFQLLKQNIKKLVIETLKSVRRLSRSKNQSIDTPLSRMLKGGVVSIAQLKYLYHFFGTTRQPSDLSL